MRIAAFGAAAAALLGGTLAVMPLSTDGTPMRGSGACGNGAGTSCDRLASVLVPEPATPPGGAASAGPVLAAPPASAAPAPAQAAEPAYALPAPHPVAAQVPAPGGVGAQPGVPSASVPGLGVPAVPGQTALPAVGVPGV